MVKAVASKRGCYSCRHYHRWSQVQLPAQRRTYQGCWVPTPLGYKARSKVSFSTPQVSTCMKVGGMGHSNAFRALRDSRLRVESPLRCNDVPSHSATVHRSNWWPFQTPIQGHDFFWKGLHSQPISGHTTAGHRNTTVNACVYRGRS